jgi:hypothetical protein
MTVTAAQERPILEFLAARGIFPDNVNPRSRKNPYEYRCMLPGHAGDAKPSFFSDGIVFKCFGCGEGGGIAKLIKLLGSDPIPRAPKNNNPPKAKKRKSEQSRESLKGCSLEQLAKAKNLPIEALRSNGGRNSTYAGKPAIAISWPGGIQFRVNLDDNPKYKWQPGSKVSILGLDDLEEARRLGWALIVEGWTDYVAGRLMGLPVFAIPGAATWQQKWASQFQGIQIYGWKEPDQGGETLVKKLAQSFPDLGVIEAPEGIKDLCELRDQTGDGAREFFEDLKSEAQPYQQAPEEEDVLFKVDRESTYNHKKDKTWQSRKRDNTRPSALWDFCCETFPDPPGIEPKTKSHILYSETDKSALVCDLRSPTWLNAANAAFKKRKFLYHGTRKLSRFDALYIKYMPVDDWSEKWHDTKTKAIERAGGQYLAFDNQLIRGCWAYLSTVPVDGFTLLEDLSGWLVNALKGIRVPDSIPKGYRFRPIRGTHALTKGCDAPVDEDKGKYQVVATSKEKTDWYQVEAELRVAGKAYELLAPVYRAQYRWGIKFGADSLAEVQEFALGFGNYQLRRRGKKPAEEPTAAGVAI